MTVCLFEENASPQGFRGKTGSLPKAWIATPSNVDLQKTTFQRGPFSKAYGIYILYIYIIIYIYMLHSCCHQCFMIPQFSIYFHFDSYFPYGTYQTWGVLRLVHFTQKRHRNFPREKWRLPQLPCDLGSEKNRYHPGWRPYQLKDVNHRFFAKFDLGIGIHFQ